MLVIHIIIRSALAIVFGLVSALALRRCWNWETGRVQLSLYQDYTGMGSVPGHYLYLVIFTLSSDLLSYLTTRTEYSFMVFAGSILQLLLFITVYFTVLLVFLPLLRKYFMAKTCGELWLLPAFAFTFIHPVDNLAPLPFLGVLYIPKFLLAWAGGVWLIGFIPIFSFQILSNLSFVRRLRSRSCPVDDEELLNMWEDMQEQMGIQYPIGLSYCREIRTPLTVGLRRSHMTTYLPEKSYTAEAAGMIFSHELHHIRRRDTQTKLCLAFFRAFGWIHPLTWIAARKAEDDLELSCDEIVLTGADSVKRKKYAELLLSTADTPRGFTTCLSASAKTLRYRLKATVSENSKKLGDEVMCIVIILSCMLSGMLGMSTDRGTIAGIAHINPDSVRGAYVRDEGGVTMAVNDTAALAEYMSEVKIEKLLAEPENRYDEKGKCLYGEMEDGEIHFSMYTEYLVLSDPDGGSSRTYYLNRPADWEYIRDELTAAGEDHRVLE